MTNTDTPHRYREQRSQIAELNRLAMGQARLSDDFARRDFDRRREHLLDFDRMARIVRMGAAFIVRLDQASDGRLRAPAAERTDRFERRAAKAVERAEPPETRLTPLPGLPHLDVAPMTAEPPEPQEAAEPAPAPPPRPQWEIAREALRQRRAAAPAPPLRRSG